MCGQPQLRVGAGGSVKRHTYRCSNREIRDGGGHVTREARTLDAYVEEVIIARLSEPGLLEELVKADTDHDTAALRVELVAVADPLAARRITARQLATGTGQLTAKEDKLTKAVAAAGRRNPIQIMAGVKDLRTLWYGTTEDRCDGLPLGQRRAILDALMTVTVLPAPRRRFYHFDPDYVEIRWKA